MAEKITELTEAQRADMLRYRDEWLAHGRSCEPSDRPEAERVVRAMYAEMGEKPPHFWWCDGPASGSIVRHLVTSMGVKGLAALDNAGRLALEDKLRDRFKPRMVQSVMASLVLNVFDSPTKWWKPVAKDLAVKNAVKLADLSLSGINTHWPLWGQHDASWAAYYAWPDIALRPMHTEDQRKKLNWWLDLARSTGWWHPYRALAFMCERPASISLDATGRLHAECVPAMTFRDGWELYALWGVRFDRPEDAQRWVVPPAESLDTREVLSIQNAEQRMAVIRRLGIERFIDKLAHRVLEKSGDGMYELLAVDLNGTDARYLKMRNPSVPGIYHVEGVEGDTIEAAMRFRNGGDFEHISPVT